MNIVLKSFNYKLLNFYINQIEKKAKIEGFNIKTIFLPSKIKK